MAALIRLHGMTAGILLAQIVQRIKGMGIVPLIICLIVFGLYVYSIMWAFKDAQLRGKSGCLIALLVAVVPFVGPILWLALRPKGTRWDRGRRAP